MPTLVDMSKFQPPSPVLCARESGVAQAEAAGPDHAVAQGLVLKRKARQLVRRRSVSGERESTERKQKDTAKGGHR